MNRRNFLKYLTLAATPQFNQYVWATSQHSLDSPFPTFKAPLIVNLMLDGGPDFLHLIPPAYSSNRSSLGFKHWQSRAKLHKLDNNNQKSWETHWLNNYFQIPMANQTFGVLKNSGWLKEQIVNGHVSIYNNVISAKTKDHNHCKLAIELGDHQATLQDSNKPGWGGKFAVNTGSNIIALTRNPRKICHCPDLNGSAYYTLNNVVSAANTRAMSLFKSNNEQSPRAELANSLQRYYTHLRNSSIDNAIYQKFIQHEQELRHFGKPVQKRLSTFPVPQEIQNLLKKNTGLNSHYFALQIRNLYDSLACRDIFNMSIASMDYLGWDSHTQQQKLIEPKFNDLFGYGKALDVLYKVLPTNIGDQLIWVIGGEFARSSQANGLHGTEHSDANQTMLIIHTGKKTKTIINEQPITISELIRQVTNSINI